VCRVGCECLHIGPPKRRITLGGTFAEGGVLMLDGHAG
jgi:hypothetical protein